jgi:hypothetical protein
LIRSFVSDLDVGSEQDDAVAGETEMLSGDGGE